MTAVALKGLLGRKLRSILTGLAIVLGVAMISGTFILTDTINKAFSNVFNVSYRHTDAVITGKQFVSEASRTPSIPASVLGRVHALPDVAAATGSYLFDKVKLIDRHGKTIASGGAPSPDTRTAIAAPHPPSASTASSRPGTSGSRDCSRLRCNVTAILCSSSYDRCASTAAATAWAS